MAGSPEPVDAHIKTFIETWPNQSVNRQLGDLPKQVKALCADANGRLAAPGAKWEMSDVITSTSKALPRARLIWFTRHKNQFLVYFQKGGFAPSSYIYAIDASSNSKVRVLWRAYAPLGLSDFSALIDALHKGRILEDD